jgi:hypothetical protein
MDFETSELYLPTWSCGVKMKLRKASPIGIADRDLGRCGSDEFPIMGQRSESHRAERRRRRRVFRAVLTVPRGRGGPLAKSLRET